MWVLGRRRQDGAGTGQREVRGMTRRTTRGVEGVDQGKYEGKCDKES